MNPAENRSDRSVWVTIIKTYKYHQIKREEEHRVKRKNREHKKNRQQMNNDNKCSSVHKNKVWEEQKKNWKVGFHSANVQSAFICSWCQTV